MENSRNNPAAWAFQKCPCPDAFISLQMSLAAAVCEEHERVLKTLGVARAVGQFEAITGGYDRWQDEFGKEIS